MPDTTSSVGVFGYSQSITDNNDNSNDNLLITDVDDSLLNQQHGKKNAKRLALLFSSIAALASGTPYLYGVYSPQLISRCGFSALDSSYLSFAGNIGSSIGGFFAGLIIDKFGVRVGLLLGAILQFTGFFLFYISYKYALHNFVQLLFSMVCIGLGSVLAYFATIKVATFNFPKHRGVANAFPVSSFGLAALFYAFVSTVWFAGNTEGLLKFIALFSGILITFSSFFIEIYENNEDDENDHGTHNDFEDESSDENEFELSMKYLMKGHRGSFAQVNNILRNDSSSSLFSDISEVSSLLTNSSTSISREPSLHSVASLNPISINSQQQMLRYNNNISSSPLDFKVKQSVPRSASFRIASSFSSSPRNSRLFGSATQKSIKMPSTEESPLVTTSNDAIATTPTAPSYPSSLKTLASSTNLHFSNHNKTPSNDFKNMIISEQSNNIPTGLTSDSLNQVNPNTANNNSFTDNSEAFTKSLQTVPKRKSRKKKKLTTKEHISQLFYNKLFTSHYILNAFYCAIGQVYIYGIGFIVRAQVNYYRTHKPESIFLKFAIYLSNSSDSAQMAVAYQALQVSIISFSNFLGRLISGPASDLVHKKLKLSKIYVVIISLIILFCGQMSLIFCNKLDFLSLTSFLIGLSYGSIYGTMPSIVADSFGSTHFATTWALLGTGPITVFLILSDYFGTVYDSRSKWFDLDDKKVKMCFEGRNCYKDVFKLNSMICGVLFLGYIWLVIVSQKRERH